jgi:hypothetical protein
LGGTPIPVEENMALARRFMEARLKGNLEAVDEMMAPDYVNHTSLLSVQEPDREGVKWATAQLSGAISNTSIHFEDQADELSARGMPLGLMPGMPYEKKETTLLPGDDVLFCTDGLVEAHDSTGEMFGSPRLRGFLSERSERGRELSGALMEELARFTGEGWEQEDDITSLRYDVRWPELELRRTPSL